MSPRPLAHIVDDNPDIRETLAMLLRTASIDVKSYPGAAAFLDNFRGADDTPSVILLDVRMPGMSGMDLLAQLRIEHPALSVIMITGHGDIDMAVKAMKLGAKDFVTKPFRSHVVLDCVREALQQAATRNNPTAVAGAGGETRLEALTAREREIFNRLVSGESNKVVAANLGISIRTVETHRAHIMDKLEAKTLVDLVLLSVQRQPSP